MLKVINKNEIVSVGVPFATLVFMTKLNDNLYDYTEMNYSINMKDKKVNHCRRSEGFVKSIEEYKEKCTVDYAVIIVNEDVPVKEYKIYEPV